MVLLNNVKMRFRLSEVLAEQRRIESLDFPVCKSLLDEVVILMRRHEKEPARQPKKIPQLQQQQHILKPVVPPKTPRRMPASETMLFARAVHASVVLARFRKRCAKKTKELLVARKTNSKLKHHLKAYSVIEEIDMRLEEKARKAAQVAREADERNLMALNERICRSVEMHVVDVRDVFFVKTYHFLQVTTFMNQARDMMIVVTRPTEFSVFPALFFAEADLRAAANEFHTRANKLKDKVADQLPGTTKKESFLSYFFTGSAKKQKKSMSPLPDFAVQYLFMLGRLTILERDPTLLGVESVLSIEEAVGSGRVTTSALGNYEKLALAGWHPTIQAPDPKLKRDFLRVLIETKQLVSGGEGESEKLRQIQRDLQQHTSVIQDLNSRDAQVLDDLINGTAPTQKMIRTTDEHDDARARQVEGAGASAPPGGRPLTAKKSLFGPPKLTTRAGIFRSSSRTGSSSSSQGALSSSIFGNKSPSEAGKKARAEDAQQNKRLLLLHDAATKHEKKTIPQVSSTPALIKEQRPLPYKKKGIH